VPTKPLKLSPLVMVGTLLLIVASLYWARAVLMPVALALLLTFLLSPLTARSNASAWVGWSRSRCWRF